MTETRIHEILKEFGGKRILVLGDLMLDHYFWGRANRISPEAPVPVVAVESETFLPGGGANVIHNLHVLGVDVAVIGVIGTDTNGEKLKTLLTADGVDLTGLIADSERPTTTKIRIMARTQQHQNQQIVRVDQEMSDPIRGSLCGKLQEAIHSASHFDAIYVSDYAKGAVTQETMDSIRKTKQRANRPVIVDPKGRDFAKYHGVTAISPNQSEALGAFNLDEGDESTIRDVGHRLVKQFEIPQVFMTRGDKGVALFESDGNLTQISASSQEVFDVSGAGDTTAAVYMLALIAGASPKEAAELGNLAGGISVGKVGVATVTKDELLNEAESSGQ